MSMPTIILVLFFINLNIYIKQKVFLKKTIDLQKNYGLAFFSLGNVHADLKEYNEAMSHYQKAIEIKSKNCGSS